MAQTREPMLQRDLVELSAIAQPAKVAALSLLARNGSSINVVTRSIDVPPSLS